MKIAFTCICLLLLACGSNNRVVADKKKPQLNPAEIAVQAISLDDAGPTAEVSLARNLYFIFDGSGSMAEKTDQDCGGDQNFANKLEGAKWAARTFLEQVPSDVRLGLYVFDGNGSREVVPLGQNNRQAFDQAIQNVVAGGGTPLNRAMVHGANMLRDQYIQQLGYGEFRLIVITDGIAERIPKAATYTLQFGFPIYAIGLCVEPNHPLRTYATHYKAADHFEDLKSGLEETLAELPSFDASEFEAVEENTP